MRFLPLSNWPLMVAAVILAGVRNVEPVNGIDLPGVDPPCQVMPAEFDLSEGTRTL